MRRWSSLLALAALVLAPPNAAAVRLGTVDTSGYPIVRVTAVTTTPSALRPALRENGRRVALLRAENLGRAKAVVLAIDRSQSMSGDPLRDAVAAAHAFLAASGPADRTAVVTFGAGAAELAPLSLARTEAAAALARVRVDPRPGTALYDAVALGASTLGAEPRAGRVVVLFTDGRDTSSAATLRSALAGARAAGATVYPIAVRGSRVTAAPLRRLARGTAGRFYSAPSSAALPGIAAEIAAELRRTWRLEYMTAARPGARLRLRVTVPGDGAAGRTVVLPPDGAEARGERASRPGGSADLLLALLVGALAFLAARAVGAYRRARWLRARLEPHDSGSPASARRRSLRERLAAASAILRVTENALGGLRQWRMLEQALERADLPLRAVELLYVMLGAGFAVALLAAVGGAPPFVTLAGLAAGTFAPYGYVRVRARRRAAAFEEQLPDVLMTLAAALKAGHSFRQGIQTIVEEGREPAAKHFGRVLREAQLGRPLDDALVDMAERIGSKNFRFVVSAVTIQRQVGGSLAGLFDMVADTVRGRQQFVRKIRSLTAMGRMSAYVLIAMPIGLGLAITAINGDYMAPLYSTSAGRMMIATGLVMVAVGSVVLRRIVAFRG